MLEIQETDHGPTRYALSELLVRFTLTAILDRHPIDEHNTLELTAHWLLPREDAGCYGPSELDDVRLTGLSAKTLRRAGTDRHQPSTLPIQEGNYTLRWDGERYQEWHPLCSFLTDADVPVGDDLSVDRSAVHRLVSRFVARTVGQAQAHHRVAHESALEREAAVHAAREEIALRFGGAG